MTSETRERILDASGELLRRQGYAATGMKEIVEQAHAPFGSIYHFFPGGKLELGAESIRRSGRLYEAVFRDFEMPREGDLKGGVRTFFAAAAAALEASDYADACPIATVALEVASTNEELRGACAEVFESWIAGGAERLQSAGMEPERARELAMQMLMALEGAFLLARTLRSGEPLRLAGEAMAALV